jgi:hypothetical protein
MSSTYLAAANARRLDASVNCRAPSAVQLSASTVARALEALLNSRTEREWRLEVAPSTLTGAGEGVMLRGRCTVGTVLAVYPGVVFATTDLPAMHKMILPGNEYVIMRRDVRVVGNSTRAP